MHSTHWPLALYRVLKNSEQSLTKEGISLIHIEKSRSTEIRDDYHYRAFYSRVFFWWHSDILPLASNAGGLSEMRCRPVSNGVAQTPRYRKFVSIDRGNLLRGCFPQFRYQCSTVGNTPSWVALTQAYTSIISCRRWTRATRCFARIELFTKVVAIVLYWPQSSVERRPSQVLSS